MTLLALALPIFIACGDKDDDTGGPTGDGGAGDGGARDGGTTDGGAGDGGDGGTGDGGSDGGAGDGGAGDGGTGDGGTGDGGAGEVSYSAEVYPLLASYGCADCHTDDTWHPGLLLTDAATTYNTLLTDAPDTVGEWSAYVVPRNPGASLLLHKLEEATPSYGGARMPKDGPYMSPAELELIATWILEGAKDN
jgi:hypothetical protein